MPSARIALASMLLSLCAGTASAQNVAMPREFAAVRQYIGDAIARGVTPSVAIAVVKEGRVVWAEGFGFADRGRKIPATADTVYWLASVSKPITATGLMKLVESGAIDLDRPANDYLPNSKLRAYTGGAEQMTVRRLANHTSGMPVHYNFYYPGSTPLTPDETIARYGFAAFAPGSRWEYSNLAFGVLEYLTQVVGKKPWRAYMDEHVYQPLGMTRTWDGVRPGLEQDAAVPYRKTAAGTFVEVERYDFDHRGASAVWSSANDLARFVRMHLNDGELDGVRVLSADSALAMRTLSGENGPRTGTGIGWAVGPFMGRDSFSHSGGMP
jgi:CubicO group peptidase (beta-lactamase class C family)